MKPILRAHMHRPELFRRRLRRQIRLNVLLPQSEPRKDVRWHMQRMRRSRSNRSITPRRGQTQVRHFRVIAGVNQVMCNTRMLRFLLQHLIKDRNRLLRVSQLRIGLGFRRKQRQA